MNTDDTDSGSYGIRALAEAYLSANASMNDRFAGYEAERTAYNVALREHRQRMLTGLQQLFGLTLTSDGIATFRGKVLFMLFTNTVRSCSTLRTPSSGFSEASLLVRTLEESGPIGEQVLTMSEHINHLTEQSRRAHLDLLEALLRLLAEDRAERVFTAEDLRTIGVDPTPPSRSAYPWDF